jgi:hypothetical protein
MVKAWKIKKQYQHLHIVSLKMWHTTNIQQAINTFAFLYRVFNLKVDRQLSREYFTSDAIYNGSASMTLYYYMCRSW